MVEREFLLQLTNELYRLTLLFPKKEPLRYKMREIADEILALFILTQNPTSIDLTRSSWSSNLKEKKGLNFLLSKLEILDSFFEVAKNQNWVSPSELLNLQTGYSNLKKELISNFKETTKVDSFFGKGINQRQEKILAFLKEKGQIQVGQIKKLFPEVSKRTLRRDFNYLLRQGKIERIGERNKTYYQLKES